MLCGFLTTYRLQVVILTNWKICFLGALYRVTVAISNSNASIEHGGEVGLLAVDIVGIKGRADVLNLFK